ncbi:MAG: OsmC-related (seleno)protein, partial [Candidatus Binatia bacterium]
EKVRELVNLIEKGCHTMNTIKNPIPVTGKLVHNGKEFEI